MTHKIDDVRSQPKITRSYIASRLASYGFIECNSLIGFLKDLSEEWTGLSELVYIHVKIRACLEKHDDGSAWFSNLRVLAQQIEREARNLYDIKLIT